MAFVRGSNPIWAEFDLTGHLFDDQFYMFVLDNEIPYAPLPTWQDPFGNVAWDNPIRFLANGTLPNNVYFDPDTVYRLEFRQGNTQSDPLIYLVENYVPGTSGDTPINETSFSTDNQISNPQFALINFTSPLTLNSISSQIIKVAPDWFLHLTGTGNVTLTQVLLNSSVIDPTNASYALQIQLSGSWTGAYLSQRFNKNGVLWSNTVVSSSITALSGNNPQNISAILVDSQGNNLTTVLKTTALTETFNEYTGIGQIGNSINTELPPPMGNAYIEYQLALPNNCNITLTSVQLISGDVDITYPYEQTTIERQIDHTFHYYLPPLAFKPISSYLVGWDFPLNPHQINGASVGVQAIGANSAYYAWDQTIIWQSVTSSINVTQSTIGYFQLTAAANTQCAVFQYLSGKEINGLLIEAAENNISANIEMASQMGLAQPLCVSLWWNPNAIGNTLNFITALDATGHPSVTNGWVEIPFIYGGNANFVTNTTNTLQSYGFTFSHPTAYLTGKTFAIVIGTGAFASGNNLSFKSISLVPGTIPTIPAPQTFDEVLRECQRYYERSYDPATLTGTVTTTNALNIHEFAVEPIGAGSSHPAIYPEIISFNFKQTKRTIPDQLFYSTINANTPNVITMYYNGCNTSNTNPQSFSGDYIWSNTYSVISGTQSISLIPAANTLATPLLSINTATPIVNAAAWAAIQYVLDARLGVVT